VAHFVRGQLANARQGGLIEDVGLFVAVDVGRKQTFEDEVILAVAQEPSVTVPLMISPVRGSVTEPPKLQPRVERCTQSIML
jgi:hypothetical protein